MKRTALLIVMTALPLCGAAEQTIWRCGNSYSATPCTQGRPVEAVLARPAADLQAAQSLAERDKRLAQQLQQHRQREEAAASRQGAAGIYAAVTPTSAAAVAGPRKPKKGSGAKSKRPSAADGTLRAAVQATRRTKG